MKDLVADELEGLLATRIAGLGYDLNDDADRADVVSIFVATLREFPEMLTRFVTETMSNGSAHLSCPDCPRCEHYCQRCGGHNARAWFVDSDRFNAAVAALGLDSLAIICPACFTYGHELATGMTCAWSLTPATPFRHLSNLVPEASDDGV